MWVCNDRGCTHSTHFTCIHFADIIKKSQWGIHSDSEFVFKYVKWNSDRLFVNCFLAALTRILLSHSSYLRSDMRPQGLLVMWCFRHVWRKSRYYFDTLRDNLGLTIGIQIQTAARIFLCLAHTKPPIQWEPLVLSMEVNRPGGEREHSHLVTKLRTRGATLPLLCGVVCNEAWVRV